MRVMFEQRINAGKLNAFDVIANGHRFYVYFVILVVLMGSDKFKLSSMSYLLDVLEKVWRP